MKQYVNRVVLNDIFLSLALISYNSVIFRYTRKKFYRMCFDSLLKVTNYEIKLQLVSKYSSNKINLFHLLIGGNNGSQRGEDKASINK